MTQSKFVELPNGVLLNAEEISFVAQAGLNEYHVFFKTPSPITPKMDRLNFEALRAGLGAVKLAAPEGAAQEGKPVVVAAK